jgi:Domain of unknown function (DUF4267)
MFLVSVAYWISGLVGIGIIIIGARFLLSPSTAAADYGVPIGSVAGPAHAYLFVKGVRDIASGLFVFVLLAGGTTRLLGGLMAAATIIPTADAIIVARHHGPKTTVYWVHGLTAGVMAVAAAILLFVPA